MTPTKEIMMLYPKTNHYRQISDLSGIWHFRPDTDAVAESENWQTGFKAGQPITVPASWNDQLNELHDYLGDGWYKTTFQVPWGWANKRIVLRFGSVNYRCSVWLNGQHLGDHIGGHLPFEFDVTDQLEGENLLIVKVNGEVRPDDVPPGQVHRDLLDNFNRPLSKPDTNFDFFPYCGIHRPVLLYATDPTHIEDITLITTIEGADGIITGSVALSSSQDGLSGVINITGHGIELSQNIEIGDGQGEFSIRVPDAKFWSPACANLYAVRVQLQSAGNTLDEYSLRTGIRTFAVDGDTLLLNGEPIYLRGFGRHEDFHIVGRGYSLPVIIKDYEIMRWAGANSFRTTHYPYSETMLELADELGFIVISEAPAVEMYFHPDGLEERMGQWEQSLRDLVARDKNHPSVVMWCASNEPHNRRPEAEAAFKQQIDLVRSLDPTRPVMFVSYLGMADTALHLSDVIGLNRYMGWYSQPGDIPAGVQALSDELDAVYAKHQRPIIITEFGADTIPGMHRNPSVMFSEEYQVEFTEAYMDLFRTKPFVVGEHLWNLCDFATGQGTHRVGAMNYKGVFTRERQPKMAAHAVRRYWAAEDPDDLTKV